jgi:hypothetical protein
MKKLIITCALVAMSILPIFASEKSNAAQARQFQKETDAKRERAAAQRAEELMQNAGSLLENGDMHSQLDGLLARALDPNGDTPILKNSSKKNEQEKLENACAILFTLNGAHYPGQGLPSNLKNLVYQYLYEWQYKHLMDHERYNLCLTSLTNQA